MGAGGIAIVEPDAPPGAAHPGSQGERLKKSVRNRIIP